MLFALEGVGGHYECVRVHEVLVGACGGVRGERAGVCGVSTRGRARGVRGERARVGGGGRAVCGVSARGCAGGVRGAGVQGVRGRACSVRGERAGVCRVCGGRACRVCGGRRAACAGDVRGRACRVCGGVRWRLTSKGFGCLDFS